MVKKQRGVCFIVSIEKFDKPTDGKCAHEDREGADVDRENLKELFHQLGFKLIVIENGTEAEIKQRAKEVRRLEESKNGDMFVAIVLSHGKEGYFVTRDNHNYDIEDFVTDFNNEGWQPFRGKPKFIVINSCRGRGDDGRAEFDRGVHVIKANPGGATRTDSFLAAEALLETKSVGTEDMVIAFATVPGYAALRDADRGAWYIQSLCEVFMKESHHFELRELLDEVARKLSTFTDVGETRQSCSYETRNFYKKLYFNPGIDESNLYQPWGGSESERKTSFIDMSIPLDINVRKATQFRGPPYFRAYPMTRRNRGHCLIINIREYGSRDGIRNPHQTDSDFFTRMGSEVDVKNVSALFTSLHFECTVVIDPDLEGVLETCNNLATRQSMVEMDMLVVIVMANGNEKGFLMADERLLVIEDLLKKFNNSGCPALRGKPKLFICQGCRGEDTDVGVVPAFRDGGGGGIAETMRGAKVKPYKF